MNILHISILTDYNEGYMASEESLFVSYMNQVFVNKTAILSYLRSKIVSSINEHLVYS